MVLTSWGSIQRNGTIANPQAGHVGMWMIIASQWLILVLYLWTLVAPKCKFFRYLSLILYIFFLIPAVVFPDRDFA